MQFKSKSKIVGTETRQICFKQANHRAGKVAQQVKAQMSHLGLSTQKSLILNILTSYELLG